MYMQMVQTSVSHNVILKPPPSEPTGVHIHTDAWSHPNSTELQYL